MGRFFWFELFSFLRFARRCSLIGNLRCFQDPDRRLQQDLGFLTRQFPEVGDETPIGGPGGAVLPTWVVRQPLRCFFADLLDVDIVVSLRAPIPGKGDPVAVRRETGRCLAAGVARQTNNTGSGHQRGRRRRRPRAAQSKPDGRARDQGSSHRCKPNLPALPDSALLLGTSRRQMCFWFLAQRPQIDQQLVDVLIAFVRLLGQCFPSSVNS